MNATMLAEPGTAPEPHTGAQRNELFFLFLLRLLALTAMLPLSALGLGVAVFGLLLSDGEFFRGGGLLYFAGGGGGLAGCVGLIRCRMAGHENPAGRIRLNEILIVIGELTALALFTLVLAGLIAASASGYRGSGALAWGLLLSLAVLIIDGFTRLARCDAVPLAFLFVALALATIVLVISHDIPAIF